MQQLSQKPQLNPRQTKGASPDKKNNRQNNPIIGSAANKQNEILPQNNAARSGNFHHQTDQGIANSQGNNQRQI